MNGRHALSRAVRAVGWAAIFAEWLVGWLTLPARAGWAGARAYIEHLREPPEGRTDA